MRRLLTRLRVQQNFRYSQHSYGNAWYFNTGKVATVAAVLGATAYLLTEYNTLGSVGYAENDKQEEEQPDWMSEFEWPQGKEEIEAVMKERSSRIIYLYRGNHSEAKAVADHCQKMSKGMNVKPILVDMKTDGEVLIDFLKRRSLKTADEVQQQIETNSFIFANKFDDIWFWDLEIIKYFFGDILEQVFNWYQGPLQLKDMNQLLMFQSGQNDIHFISYAPDCFTDRESIKAQKTFRKFHVKNTEKQFHFKFWILQDKELAEKLKIDTTKPCDIYMMREAETPYNPEVPPEHKRVIVNDFNFESQKFLTVEDVETDAENCFAKIL